MKNSQNNDNRRKDIVESLVNKTGYIAASNQSFNEFISDSTLGKLKEQIQRDYDTIRNILDHDEYFQNPLYIQYIVDILNSIDELKDIIKTTGEKSVENKLTECLDIFRTKWNKKIATACRILTKMKRRDCSIRSMAEGLNAFSKIEDIMTKNVNMVKKSKYYKW